MKQRNMRAAPQHRRRASNWSGLPACALLGLAGYAQAATDVKTIDKVASVVTGYAESLGCAVTLDKRNVVSYSIEGNSLFLVLYSIDVGCSGGSAMIGSAGAERIWQFLRSAGILLAAEHVGPVPGVDRSGYS